jgi:hypothetical protein
MKKTISFIPLMMAISAIIMTVSCRNGEVITFRSLLREMTQNDAITRFPSPSYRLVQFSSYDRHSIHPDSAGWFANSDFTQFIREEDNDGRHEYVMFEADGPGAVVRWWMTFGNINASNSFIRVYIDNQPEPVIEGPAPYLVGGMMLAPEPLSTSVSPLTDPQRRGYDLYLPLPFSENCKITLENDSVVISPERRSPSIYYNIDARLYEEGTKVVSFKRDMLSADSLSIAACASSIGETGINETGGESKSSNSGIFAPGTACSIMINKGPQAATSLSVRIEAADTAAALKHTFVVMSFDGQETVNVPAGNFFGTGYSYNQYGTHFSGVNQDGTMYSSWFMPFRDSCHISIVNSTADSVFITAELATVPYSWDNSSMHFGASWHEYEAIETAGAERNGGTGRHIDLNIATLYGKGVYVGDAVTVFNSADAWWGEGDEKIYVDDETFPSSFGTGTEDYFGYAWSRPEPFSHALIAQPVGNGNFHPGMTVNMRYRILDAIPFVDSIRADIELWHWVNTVIDYGITAYYYLEYED